MSRATSATTGRRYGLKRVCGTWERSRSALYARRACLRRPERGDGPGRRGPIERVLASRPAAGPAAETVKGWTREWLEKASTENGAPAHAGLGPDPDVAKVTGAVRLRIPWTASSSY